MIGYGPILTFLRLYDWSIYKHPNKMDINHDFIIIMPKGNLHTEKTINMMSLYKTDDDKYGPKKHTNVSHGTVRRFLRLVPNPRSRSFLRLKSHFVLGSKHFNGTNFFHTNEILH